MAWDRQAAERTVAAAQASLLSLAITASGGDAKPSDTVGLIKQNQQGFAKLEAAAKAKAESAKTEDTKAAKDDTSHASESPSIDNEGKANVDRVTALYLGDDATPDRQAA